MIHQWKLVTVPARHIESDTSPWFQFKFRPDICLIGKHTDDDWEVAIHRSCLDWLEPTRYPINLDHHPTQSIQGLKNVHGAIHASQKARDRWLRRAAGVVRSGLQPGIKHAYLNHTQSHGLDEELGRAILVYDIEVSPPSQAAGAA
jgi:hypothetical protein